MERYFLPVIGILIIGYLLYQMITAKKRKKLKILAKVRTAYGQSLSREYTVEELEKIRKYFDLTHDAEVFSVDDITWNDLNMDAIYMAMNHTFSSAGEEVLYRILREPCFSEDELLERERLIVFFKEKSAVREALSMQYVTIGRTKRFSVVEFIDRFKSVETDNNGKDYLCIGLLGGAASLACFQPALGVFALIVVMIYNVFSYYSKKGKIEPYYVSLAAIAYLIKGAEKISAEKVPELEKYTARIKADADELRTIRKDMTWLGTGTNIGSSMDILQVFFDYFRMITHIDFIKFNRMVKMVSGKEEVIRRLIYNMGYLEAMIAVASYRETLPLYCAAEVNERQEKRITMKNGYHPLIQGNPVANSIDEARPVLLTGSNASGKSTFLRTAAVNALLAETVHTVHAETYRAPFFRIFSSMALTDSIQSGESYYIVEIKSIKRIMDRVGGEIPVLCFVDEVLRGTNTVERIAASSQILKIFADRGVFVFAATHDVELTQMLDGLYANYHFEEEIVDGQVLFSYLLKKGRATTRNAIRLLSVMGYDPEVIEKAEQTAERFMEEGVWQIS